MVNEPERLTFLPPRCVLLEVRDGRGVPADDVDILKGEKRFANVFGKCKNAVFQTIGVGNTPCETTHEAIARRIFVRNAHSPLLDNRVSTLVGLTREEVY